MHRWGNALPWPADSFGGHWGFSDVGGRLGGWQGATLVDRGSGGYAVEGPQRRALERFGRPRSDDPPEWFNFWEVTGGRAILQLAGAPLEPVRSTAADLRLTH